MTAAWDWPCRNSRAAANRRASSAALRRAPRCGVVMPQHRMVLDEIHHFISRDSLASGPLLLPERIARPVQVDHPSVCKRVRQHWVGLATDEARLPRRSSNDGSGHAYAAATDKYL